MNLTCAIDRGFQAGRLQISESTGQTAGYLLSYENGALLIYHLTEYLQPSPTSVRIWVQREKFFYGHLFIPSNLLGRSKLASMILFLTVTLLQCFLVVAGETGNQLGKIKMLSTSHLFFFHSRYSENSLCFHLVYENNNEFKLDVRTPLLINVICFRTSGSWPLIIPFIWFID